MRRVRALLVLTGVVVGSLAWGAEKAGHLSAPPVDGEPAVHVTPGVAKAKKKAVAPVEKSLAQSPEGHAVDVPHAEPAGALSEPPAHGGAAVESPEKAVSPSVPAAEKHVQMGAASEEESAKSSGAAANSAGHDEESEHHVVKMPKDESHTPKASPLRGWLWFGGVFAVLAVLIFMFT
jgi:hypothetical protein